MALRQLALSAHHQRGFLVCAQHDRTEFFEPIQRLKGSYDCAWLCPPIVIAAAIMPAIIRNFAPIPSSSDPKLEIRQKKRATRPASSMECCSKRLSTLRICSPRRISATLVPAIAFRVIFAVKTNNLAHNLAATTAGQQGCRRCAGFHPEASHRRTAAGA